jgi:DNA modification methylase
MSPVEIRVGDCLDALRSLDAGCVQTCVTSPPYFGLRDYGVAGQIGLEPTPDEYVAKLVAVFREVRRVLADDGTLWLNLGDSYSRMQPDNVPQSKNRRVMPPSMRERIVDLPPKNLIGIPWRVAFALQADGWYLRSDIIWHKPNPMPESVTDRPTKAHEYLFLLAKSERYYYDSDAVAEDAMPEHASRYAHAFGGAKAERMTEEEASGAGSRTHPIGARVYSGKRNRRTVWTVATQPYSGAHFATFPPALIEPCILAGSRPGDTVLDPFGGAGTTGLVADRHSRHALLIELNPAYAKLARERIDGEAPLFAGGVS